MLHIEKDEDGLLDDSSEECAKDLEICEAHHSTHHIVRWYRILILGLCITNVLTLAALLGKDNISIRSSSSENASGTSFEQRELFSLCR